MVDGWQRSTLGEHVRIFSGNSPSQVSLTKSGYYPFVKVEDLNNCKKYQNSGRAFTNERKFCAPAGSIIFPKRGAAILNNKIRIATVNIAMDTNLMALQPDDMLDCEFLFYLIQREGLFKIADTSTIPQLNNKHINPYEFFLPPLPEQRKIAEILRTWDEGIEKLEVLRAAKLSRYSALARRFFDPCHSAFQKRLDSWREFELGEVFRERTQPGEEGDTLLSITMSEGVIDRNNVGRKDTSNEDKSRYKLILPGDIGYNTMRMWQGVSGLSMLRGIVSPAYTIVTPDNRNITARYAAHLFKSRRMVFDFQRYSQGLTSDTWNLKFPAFSKIKVFLPL